MAGWMDGWLDGWMDGGLYSLYRGLRTLENTAENLVDCRVSSLTCRPTRLLWILIRAWMSLGDPRESSQSREKRSPKRVSWLQPPHSQVSCRELSWSGWGLSRAEGWAGCRPAGGRVKPPPAPPFCSVRSCSWVSFMRILSSSSRRLASQPQPCSLPMLQAKDTEWATPAASSDREKALSRKPAGSRNTSVRTVWYVQGFRARLMRNLSHSPLEYRYRKLKQKYF